MGAAVSPSSAAGRLIHGDLQWRVAPLLKLDCAVPVAALCDCVRYFQQCEARIAVAAVVYPIAARPEQILEFHASGFYRLFRAPMADLADHAYDARSVIGPVVSEIEQKIADASSFREQVRVATDFLLLLRHLSEWPSSDAVPAIANRFLQERGDFERFAGESPATFVRRFLAMPEPWA
jgi:hypothetical protein